MIMNIDFKVSVRCMTYNQAAYIEDAMNGFCMQQTDFPFVCNVMDDASTDGEQEIIYKYLDSHFDLEENTLVKKDETDDYKLIFARHKKNKNCYFAVFFLKYNHYRSQETKNKKLTYFLRWESNCDYIALCEGDDYWIDSNKLTDQVDFLDNNSDYGMVYGKCQYYFQNKCKLGKFFGGPNETFVDLLTANTIPTLTVLYRRNLAFRYETEVKEDKRKWRMGDYPMWLYYSKISKIKFCPNVVGIYRVLQNSASHYMDIVHQENFLENMYQIKAFYCNKYDYHSYNIKNSLLIEYARIALQYGDLDRFVKYTNSIENCPLRFKIIHNFCSTRFIFPIICKLYNFRAYLPF